MKLLETEKQEIRGGWLGVPEAYQPLDFLGVALGSYFIYEGATDRGPQWLTISLGAIMVWIHAQRFFYAPQTRDGLIRLMEAIDVKPHDICPHLPTNLYMNQTLPR